MEQKLARRLPPPPKKTQKERQKKHFPWSQRGTSPPFPSATPMINFFKIPLEMNFLNDLSGFSLCISSPQADFFFEKKFFF